MELFDEHHRDYKRMKLSGRGGRKEEQEDQPCIKKKRIGGGSSVVRGTKYSSVCLWAAGGPNFTPLHAWPLSHGLNCAHTHTHSLSHISRFLPYDY